MAEPTALVHLGVACLCSGGVMVAGYVDWKKKAFCVYLYLDDHGKPFYVGMGSLRRPYVKRRRIPPPGDKSKILVSQVESREVAMQMEIMLIQYWGRRENGGLLLNGTKGGGGLREPSLEAREKIRAFATGRQRTADWKLNQIAANDWRTRRDNWLSPDGNIVFSYAREIIRNHPEQKLDFRSLHRVLKGKLVHHKGWTLLDRALNPRVSKTKYQLRVWQHPDHGEVTAYTQELAARYGLQHCKLSMVARGQRKHHKGWRFLAVATPPTLLSAA